MRFWNYDWEIISCDSETTIRKLLRAIQKLRLGNSFVRLINYGSKIMDHMFILKGIGWLAALKGLSIFAIVCFDNVQGMLVRWVGVGWASLALARHHDGTWGGVGLITFLGTCTPTWCYVRDGMGWGGANVPWHLRTNMMLRWRWGGVGWGTCTPTWCYVGDGVDGMLKRLGRVESPRCSFQLSNDLQKFPLHSFQLMVSNAYFLNHVP